MIALHITTMTLMIAPFVLQEIRTLFLMTHMFLGIRFIMARHQGLDQRDVQILIMSFLPMRFMMIEPEFLQD